MQWQKCRSIWYLIIVQIANLHSKFCYFGLKHRHKIDFAHTFLNYKRQGLNIWHALCSLESLLNDTRVDKHTPIFWKQSFQTIVPNALAKLFRDLDKQCQSTNQVCYISADVGQTCNPNIQGHEGMQKRSKLQFLSINMMLWFWDKQLTGFFWPRMIRTYFVCLFVVNFNLRYKFWTTQDRTFIFGMHTSLMMSIQMTPNTMALTLIWVLKKSFYGLCCHQGHNVS